MQEPHNPYGMPEHADDVYVQKIQVNLAYPVYFTRHVFDLDNPVLANAIALTPPQTRVLVYVDSGVAQCAPDLLSDITRYAEQYAPRIALVRRPCIIAGGERAKNSWHKARDIAETIGDHQLDRHSTVIAVGGGAVLDTVGFAVSLVHRGLRLIRIPTTVLAQNDAGIGVKTGINAQGTKNFLGTFAAPFAVINDPVFLTTLDEPHWRGGIAEAFKVALIKDADFFDFLCAHARHLRDRDMDAMVQLIRRCAQIHLDHIRSGGDPFETGNTRPLDFGHWSAHRLETLSDFTIGHGQAVAIGIALDACYASRTGHLGQDGLQRLLTGLSTVGLPPWSAYLDQRNVEGRLDILDGIEQFREHIGGPLCITLPHSIGKSCEVHDLDPVIIESCIQYLKDRWENDADREQQAPHVLP
jgi:3-dehydroquinate synthase